MDPPQDKGNVAYWSLFLLGAGVLCPWNAFITAADYFGEVYPGGHMIRKFSVSYFPCMMATLIIMIIFSKMMSIQARIRVGFAGFTLILLLIPILDLILISGSKAPALAQVITLIAVAFLGIFDGIAQGAVYGEASYFPELYQQAYASGTAASGLLISFLRILTKIGLSGSIPDMRISTAIYFLSSAMLCTASLFVSSSILPKLPITKYYKDKARGLDKGGQDGDLVGDGAQSNMYEQVTEEDTIGLVSKSPTGKEYIQVISKTRLPIASLVFIYTITLTIFPGVPAEDVSKKDGSDGGWYIILLITIFNIADFIGKSAPPRVPMIANASVLTAASACRVIFLPIFLLALWFAPHPALFFFLTFALGLTNGYLTVNSFILGPKFLDGSEYDTGGNVLVLALVVGLVAGSFGGWGLLRLENL